MPTRADALARCGEVDVYKANTTATRTSFTTYLAGIEEVPIAWVAVGDPAQLFPPGEHEAIWRVQEPLNFPLTVYGFSRAEATMVRITQSLSRALASHLDDETRVTGGPP